MQGGYCLKLYTSPAAYSDARDTCARDGGHLYKVGSVEDKQVFADPKVTGEVFLAYTGSEGLRYLNESSKLTLFGKICSGAGVHSLICCVS